MFARYTIGDIDRFDPHVYPCVVEEIDQLRTIFKINSSEKTAIVLSFLKEHCIKTQWVDANKQFVALLTSGSLRTAHVEALFVACKQNAAFLLSLEIFISVKLTAID